MIVADIAQHELARTLAGPGLRLRTGPFVSRICSKVQELAEAIALLYAEHGVEDPASFADFDVRVSSSGGLRRWVRPQLRFELDGATPFHPFPARQALPIFEWGLNWCVSGHCHQYLILHAAVLEKSAGAIVMCAPPGSGKSTLCAGLTSRGWRLLSDELALIEPQSGAVAPLPRPIGLKNASIDVIRSFIDDAVLGPTVRDTAKGAIAHLKPPLESVRRATESALPRWVLLPRYERGVATRLEPLRKARAFMALADNAFNYHLHGRRGFKLLARLVERCACYELVYGELEAAVPMLDSLAAAA